jgi:hypothetical protein
VSNIVQGDFLGKTHYRSLDHLVDDIESMLSEIVCCATDMDVDMEWIIGILDDIFRIVLPVTHFDRWTYRCRHDKEAIAWVIDEDCFRLAPSAADLEAIDPQAIEYQINHYYRQM